MGQGGVELWEDSGRGFLRFIFCLLVFNFFGGQEGEGFLGIVDVSYGFEGFEVDSEGGEG